MKYRQLGNTGIDVSLLGFGAMRLPTGSNGRVDQDQGVELIRYAIEKGINLIDTAPYYCKGRSEKVVGEAIKGLRDQIYLATKYSVVDATGDSLRRDLENSLKKLDVECIDFYNFWGIDHEKYDKRINVRNGPLEAALKAKEEGLIRFLSFSFHGKPDELFKLVDTGHFATMTVQYNLLDRANEKAIAYGHQKGLGVIVMGPIGGGRLGYPSEIGVLVQDRTSTPELALRFVFNNPFISSALSGMSTVEMVTENVNTVNRKVYLEESDLKLLERALAEKKKLADLYCTGCNYCAPCPNKVDIAYNFLLMNYYRVYDLKEYAVQTYNQLGRGSYIMQKPAVDCIECGICLNKCPQKIPIIAKLKEVNKILSR